MENIAQRITVLLITVFICQAAGGYAQDDKISTGSGTVIVGLGVAKGTSVYLGYTLRYRSKDKRAQGGFQFIPSSSIFSKAPDFNGDEGLGFVQTVKLAPGDYEVSSFTVYINFGLTRRYAEPRQEFSIPFNIGPDEVVYLGRFMAVAIEEKNIFGRSLPVGATVMLSDKGVDDVRSAQNKDPALKVDTFKRQVSSAETIGHPSIRSADGPLR